MNHNCTDNDATRNFIRFHREKDVRQLALQAGRHPDIDMPYALQQIQGWQKAKTKIPSWAATDGIVYPPHLNMEQCSSEQTARYKASLCGEGHTMVDLTGGFGIDFSFMSQRFERAFYIERNPQLCAISSGNFQLLGLDNVTAVCQDCEDFLPTLDHADLIYIDPARRDGNGGKTFAISDCTPDILQLMPLLLEKADRLLIKLSPMLDWHKAVADTDRAAEGRGKVSRVHVVAVKNECKELLLEMDAAKQRATDDTIEMVLVNDDQTVSYRIGEAENVGRETAAPEPEDFVYLYEPNVAILKAGCTALVASRHGLKPISRNSHLCVAGMLDRSFPGRIFSISGMATMNKHSLKPLLHGLERANTAVRNFPLTAEQLRKRLHLKDGGDDYLFGTTLADGTHVVIACKKTEV